MNRQPTNSIDPSWAYLSPYAGENIYAAAARVIELGMLGMVFNDRIVKRREGDRAQDMVDRYCHSQSEEPILLTVVPFSQEIPGGEADRL